MRHFFSIPVLLLLLLLQIATARSAPHLTVKQDTSAVYARQFSKTALDSLKAQKEFDYGPNDLKSASKSWWARLWRFVRDIFANLWNFIFGRLDKVPHGNAIFRYTLFVTALILLVYIIIKAAGLDPVRLFKGRPAKTTLTFTENEENIHLIDFDQEIDKAVRQHNYRLAVRLLYLRCLKQLSDVNLIKWEIDKTNTAYLYELEDLGRRSAFGALTRRFEYVWYGNFGIDQQQFADISLLFRNFKQLIP